MDLYAGEMASIRVKGDVNLTLEHFAQAIADSILFAWGYGYRGGHGDFLGAFRCVGKFCEGFGDLRKKADAIFPYQLFEKGFSDGRTPQTRTDFCKDGNFIFGAKSR